MKFPAKVLINDKTLEFSFHDLLDYSVFHNKRNINININILPRMKNHRIRFSQILRDNLFALSQVTIFASSWFTGCPVAWLLEKIGK